MNEKIYTGVSHDVIYKFRAAKSDRRKLLVIFSGGFGTRKHYDFDGPSSSAVKCNVLWIRDNFEENFSYYIRNSEGYGISEDIQRLISDYLIQLNISKDDVILTGFSKGGTAALYHGIKFGYQNIISTVPRIRIGTANIKRRPEVYRYLIGEEKHENTAILDSMLPQLLGSDNQLYRNIYLFSSESDRQYKREIIPVLPLLRKYENFNFILTSSRLVRRHHEVTRYNLPLVTSIINSLVENIVPKFGEISNGCAAIDKPGEQNDTEEEKAETPKSQLSSFTIVNGRAQFRGYAFNANLETTADNISTSLVFRSIASGDIALVLPAAQGYDETLDITQYLNYFKSFAYGAFLHTSDQVADIATLAPGTYEVSICCLHGNTDFTVSETYVDQTVRWVQDKNDVYLIACRNRKLILKKYNLSELPSTTLDSYQMSTFRQSAEGIRLRGHFAVRGIELADNERYFRYKLLLSSLDSGLPASLIPLKARTGVGANSYFADPYHDYSRSRFVLDASLDELAVEKGQYRMSVLLLTEDELYQYPLEYIFEKK